MGKPAPTVVVASDDPALLDEIVRHLEELPAWRLAGWARTAGELQRLLAEHAPDAALISGGLARELDPAQVAGRPAGSHSAHPALSSSGTQPGHSVGQAASVRTNGAPGVLGALRRAGASPGGADGTRLVIVATEQDAAILRCSLRLGAGFVLWPQERADLQAAVEGGMPAPALRRGQLVAVWAPKGGSGASVLAAHLAGAVAGVASCLLADLDLRHGDQRVLLGAGNHPRSILDLLAAGDDVPPTAVKGVAWTHPAGFGVILAPPSAPWPAAGGGCLPETWSGIAPALDAVCNVGTIGQGRGMVVADLPSGLGRLSLEVAEQADATAIVVTPDLLALRRARDASRLVGEGAEVGVLLNRWSRAAGVLSPDDVEAVLSLPVWASIPAQTGLQRTPDLGRLSRSACRALAPLATHLATRTGPPEISRLDPSPSPATNGRRDGASPADARRGWEIGDPRRTPGDATLHEDPPSASAPGSGWVQRTDGRAEAPPGRTSATGRHRGDTLSGSTFQGSLDTGAGQDGDGHAAAAAADRSRR